jgi:DNA-binding MarR family transcriptional regulator
MVRDSIDQLIEQWASERPDLDYSRLSSVLRIELAGKLLTQAANRGLAALNMKLWEYEVLSVLRRQGPPFQLLVTEIAKASMVTSAAMTSRIDRLEAKGFVKRKPNSDDRRAVSVLLTAKGRDLINRALEARVKVADDLMAALTERDREVLSAKLRKSLVLRNYS